jgi:hypothetical protein
MLQFHGCTETEAEEALSEMAGLLLFGAPDYRVLVPFVGSFLGVASVRKLTRGCVSAWNADKRSHFGSEAISMIVAVGSWRANKPSLK